MDNLIVQKMSILNFERLLIFTQKIFFMVTNMNSKIHFDCIKKIFTKSAPKFDFPKMDILFWTFFVLFLKSFSC